MNFFLFGNLPNCDSKPDLSFGDIKTTHLKSLKHGGYNAKERLTITNCGTTADYDSFNSIVTCEELNKSPYYTKIQKGLLCSFLHEGGKSHTWEEIETRQVLTIFPYDIAALPTEMRDILQEDYEKIRTRVLEKTVSQKGQRYLHIHPHGCKGGNTRALGFTNHFVTRLIAHGIQKSVDKLSPNSRSIFIAKDCFVLDP